MTAVEDPPIPDVDEAPEVSENDDTRDRAVSPRGFRNWLLEYADGRYSALSSRIGRWDARSFPTRYDREVYLKSLDYDPDLTELLIQAEMEWRVEMAARETLDRKLEIDTHSGFSFRDPAQTNKCRFVTGRVGKSGAGAVKETYCGKTSVSGTVRCREHGGELVDAKTRQAVLMSSYLQIVEASALAVDTLIDVASTSRNDIARVQAAKEILDRAGLTAELQVTVKLEGEQRDERMSNLRAKLDTMQRGLMSRAIDATSEEVVPEDMLPPPTIPEPPVAP